MLKKIKKFNFFSKKPISRSIIGRRGLFLLFFIICFAIFLPKIAFGFDIVDSIIAPPLMAVVNFFGRLCSFFIWMLIQVAQYNDFINSPAVSKGWILMRDIFNMFFVIILLVIAFATVLKIETYSYKRLMPVFIVSAVLINFSKLICGVIIDISQILMLTFISAVQSVATADFVEIFGLTKMLELRDNIESGVVISAMEMFGALILALIMVLVSLGVIMTMTLLLVFRIVMIWFYVLLSPMAFMATILPGTKSYASQWWSDFIKQVIIGPVLAFFLWISFSVVSVGASSGMIESGAEPPSATVGSVGEPSFMFNFLIGIAMLIGSLLMAQKLGVAGGKMAGGAVSKVKGMTIGKAQAKIKEKVGRATEKARGVGKGVAGAALKAPIKGLKALGKAGGRKLQEKDSKIARGFGKTIEKGITPIESVRQLKGMATKRMQKRKQSRLDRIAKGKGTIMDKAAQGISEEYEKHGAKDRTVYQEIRREKLEQRQKQAKTKHDDEVLVKSENDEAYALEAAGRGLLKIKKQEKMSKEESNRLEELKTESKKGGLEGEDKEEFEKLTKKEEKAVITKKNNERVQRIVGSARNKFAGDPVISKSFDDHIKNKGDANLAYDTFYKDNPEQLAKDIKTGDFGVSQLMKLDKETIEDLGETKTGGDILDKIKTEDFQKFAKSTDSNVQEKFGKLFKNIKPENIKEKDRQKLIDAGRSDLAFGEDEESNNRMVKKMESDENRQAVLNCQLQALDNEDVVETVVRMANPEDIKKMSPKKKEKILEEGFPKIIKKYEEKKATEEGLVVDEEKGVDEEEDYRKIQTTYIKTKKGKDISNTLKDSNEEYDEEQAKNLSKQLSKGNIKPVDLSDLDIEREDIKEEQKENLLGQIAQGMKAGDIMKLRINNPGLSNKIFDKLQEQANNGDKKAKEKVKTLNDSEWFSKKKTSEKTKTDTKAKTETKEKTKTDIKVETATPATREKEKVIDKQETKERTDEMLREYNNFNEPANQRMFIQDYKNKPEELSKMIVSASLEQFEKLEKGGVNKEIVSNIDQEELSKLIQMLLSYKNGQEKLTSLFDLKNPKIAQSVLKTESEQVEKITEKKENKDSIIKGVSKMKKQDIIDSPEIAINLAQAIKPQGLGNLRKLSKEIADAIIQAIGNESKKENNQVEQLIPILKETEWINNILKKQEQEEK